MKPIFHICSEQSWEDQFDQEGFRDPSLEKEGFIHCSYQEQVSPVAAARFVGRQDLLMMEIDPAKVDVEIKVEDSYGAGNEFPHVYGPIPLGSVRRVYRLAAPTQQGIIWPMDGDLVFARNP